jgi:hypothetical protein
MKTKTMTISRMKLKMMLAGAFVACGVALNVAWASPGQGTTSTALSGPAVHILRNEGAVDLEIVVVQIVPYGAPRRIEASAP